MTKALVILSGGQDSVTTLYWALAHFEAVHAISVNYGQRHSIELESAKIASRLAGVKSHEIVEVPQVLVSTSPLTSSNELEQYDSFDQMDKVIGDRVELTFVPMRNPFFFTIAANRAVALGCDVLVTGICQEDNANYPDCREEFRALWEKMANTALGVKHLKLVAPLMDFSKERTVNLAIELGAMNALAYSHTSYDGKYPPTDMNHSNVLRAHGFEAADVPDPLVLRAWSEGLMELPETSNYSKDLVEQAFETWGLDFGPRK